MNSFRTVKVDGQPNCLTEFDPLELVPFLATDFLSMNTMKQRAQMSGRHICDRKTAVLECFDLPYDAPPLE